MRKKLPVQTRRQKFSNWIIIFAIIVMCSATYWVVKNNYKPPTDMYETPTFSNKVIELGVFFNETQERFETKLTEKYHDLMFKVSTTFPAYVALFVKTENQLNKIIFSGTRVPPGKDRLVERQGEKFVYNLDRDHPSEVCLLYADSQEEIEMELRQLSGGSLIGLKLQCSQLI